MQRIFAAEEVIISEIFQPAEHFNTVGSLVDVFTKNAFTIAGVIFLVLLIFGGFQYIVSAGSGDAKSMEKGKTALTAAVMGLLVVVGSFWIVQLIELITGISILPK